MFTPLNAICTNAEWSANPDDCERRNLDEFLNDGVDIVPAGLTEPSPSGARARNAEELAAAIKAASGKLTVGAQSSYLIVALNNNIRFAVTRNAVGQYEITDRLNATNLLLLAIPAVVLIALMAKR